MDQKLGISGLKQKKVNLIFEFCRYELVYAPNYCLNWQFWFFWPSLPKKAFSGRKEKEWISPFKLKLTIWLFEPNLPEKGKENITIEFCFFWLIKVKNLHLYWLLWGFLTKFTQKGYLRSKPKKATRFYILELV